MKLLIQLLLIAGTVLISPAGAIAGSATGGMTLDGEDYPLSSVLAKTEENPNDDARKDIVVLITDTVLTRDQFNMSTLYRLSMDGKVHGIVATFNDEQECTGLVILGVTQKSGSRVCDFVASRFDAERIAGRMSVKPQKSSGHSYEFSVQFESPVTDAIARPVSEMTGNQLPTGGGEPGKAYLEYDRAIRTGNIGALKKFAPSDEAAKELDTPDAKGMIEMMKGMRPTDVRITKGFISGDRATLLVEGRDVASGDPVTATVSMVKSGARWKIENESWKEAPQE